MTTGDEFPSALLLDSGGGWLGKSSGGCIIFSKPRFTLSSGIYGTVISDGEKTRKISGDPVREIEKKTSEGYFAVGFFSYEYLQKTHDGRSLKKKICENKKAGFSPTFLNFHFYDEKSVSFSNKFPAEKTFSERNRNRLEKPAPDIAADFSSSEKRFLENVRKIKSHIEKGDVYQVNISEAWKIPNPDEPLNLFLRLFNSQPVPFASYMDFGEFQFISGSMELFLEKTGKEIVSHPIKGTAKRGINSLQDSRIKQSLSANRKERAEILMITDLMRNDLSRICSPSSVKTKKIFNVKSYKTLFHMESEICGTLRKNISLCEIMEKTFPPGSVTGAPKTKALEIIDSLESHSRGPYCGAAGIFYPDGNFRLSVSIRCLRICRENAVCWSGAGIVWNSDPEKEFRETALKLEALKNAIAAGN